MRWPPNKAWTSTSLRVGYRHFVAINYGGKGSGRWVNLVSVLDGNSRLKVFWKEMKDPSLWQSGWLQLPKEESFQAFDNTFSSDLSNTEVCLHPSEDSGLILPSDESIIRPWFSSPSDDEN